MWLICLRCKGTGEVIDKLYTLFTLGFGALDPVRCKACDGKGKVYLGGCDGK